MSGYTGYKDNALKFLSDNGVAVSDTVKIIGKEDDGDGKEIQVVVMPRYEYCDDAHITVKLKSGYNVGLAIDAIKEISKVVAPSDDIKQVTEKKTEKRAGLPNILLLTTGGTIASKVDYRTGAVTSVLTAEELVESVPELSEMANIDAKVLFSEYSENIVPAQWIEIAKAVSEYAESDYAGIIIAHGTDTMHYTSSFLSFALAGFQMPIVLVGAQRSSDRASSDAALNLIGTVKFISECADARGVYVAMHKGSSDDVIACHVGTRVRKNHASKRGAFETVGGEPAFLVRMDDGGDGDSGGHGDGDGDGDKNNSIDKNMQTDFFADGRFTPKIRLNENVALVKYHPGYKAEMLESIIDSGYNAIIFEGTGMGHIGKNMYPAVGKAHRQGIFMGMTSQCLDGKVRMTVYESGRDLLNLGITPLGNMIAEVALVKAMWVTGDTVDSKEVEQRMLKEVASEFSEYGGSH